MSKEPNPIVDGCRWPKLGECVTVNPDPTMRREVLLAFDPAEPNKPYLVSKKMEKTVLRRFPAGSTMRVMLFTARNRAGVYFLWPVATPVPEKHPVWDAMKGWVELLEWEEETLH